MSTQLTLRDDAGNSLAERARTPMDLLQLAIEREGSIDVIERIAALMERERTYQSRIDFDEALNRCQGAIGRIAPNQKRNDTGSWWADYTQLDRAVRPIYTCEGFSIAFSEVPPVNPAKVRIRAELSRAGTSKEYFAEITPSTTGPKGGVMATATDADAIAQSRAKRYLMLDIFNIAIGIDAEEKHAVPEPQGRAMDEGTLADFLALIEGSGSVDELKANYFKARDAAEKLGDREALRGFADAKNKMYLWLSKGAK